MPICTYFCIYIEIIQQNKTPRQLMLVWGNNFREQAKSGITITFGHVTKHLVVSPVFFDYIKHILNRAGITYFLRYGISFLPNILQLQFLGIGCVFINCFGVNLQSFVIRFVNHRKTSFE